MPTSAVRIVVSGHRHLTVTPSLERGIGEAIERIDASFPGYQFHVLSCLAEGADRLLSQYLMEALRAELMVVLPLPEEEYMRDFRSALSIQEYWALKNRATRVVQTTSRLARPFAYQIANQKLLEKADLVMVIWDGLPARGPGGTAEMVAMARQAHLPMLWIHAGDDEHPAGELSEERFL